MRINLSGIIKLVDSLMVDTCHITRPDREAGAVFDESTGTYSGDPAAAVIYDGPCLIYSQRRFRGSAQEVGGALSQASDYWVEIPMDANIRVEPRDEIVVTAVHGGGDQTMLNTVFRVMDDMTGSYSVSKRIWCTRRDKVPM